MITLAKHIELLLLEHDCVIVPGLGGFIANHADARYTGEEEHLYLPPFRTIGFNQQLQVNDGLLVQSYMSAYEISYPAANLQMEKDLEHMLGELEMKGEYQLDNIGTLKKSLNHNITFIPKEAGLLTPSLYGLYSYDIQSLNSTRKRLEIEQNLQAASATMQVSTNAEKKDTATQHRDVVIRLSHRWIDLGISAAAAIALFFCVSYPTIKQGNGEPDTVVAALPSPIKNAPVSTAVSPATDSNDDVQSSMKEEVSPKKANETKTNEVKADGNQPNEEKKANEETIHKEDPKFSIVLACYVSQRNAEKFVAALAKEGFGDAVYIKKGSMSRVLYAGYPTRAEASNALRSLRNQNPAFQNAWILEL